MENRKIIVGVAALAALLLLFAGVGYAVFNGNARTYNEGNTDNLAYMTATPSDFSPFANDISTIFDTYVYDGAVYTTKAVANSDEYDAAVDVAPLFVKNGNVYTNATGFVDGTTYYTKSYQLVYALVPVADATEFTAAKAAAFEEKLYTEDAGVYTVADEYAVDTPYYAKVNIQDANKAFAFKDTASVETVMAYSCIELGTKDVTIDNQTGEAITALDVNVKAANMGTSDFVYIFEFKNGANEAKYAMFYGNGATQRDVKDLAVTSIADGSSGVVSVTLYIGYAPNVFVPESYIGPATTTNPGTSLPYIVAGVGPASIDDVDFGFNFTIPQP